MILAIDLGGTKLQYGLYSQSGKLIETATVPTDVDFLSQLKTLIKNKQTGLAMIGLGVPGPVLNNKMEGSKPLNCSDTVDFDVEFADIHVPVIVGNDLQMAAQYEIREGMGAQFQQFCLVSISTGIGVAIVNRGNILQGRIEMGHHILLPDFEPRQPCLNHDNCWVALASGAAIVKRFGNDTFSTTKDIFEHVLKEKDLLQLRTLHAHAFGTLISAYDPEAIIVMGSVGLRQFERIMPSALEVERFTINRPIPPIIKDEAAENAGMLGAYHAAQDEISRRNNQHRKA